MLTVAGIVDESKPTCKRCEKSGYACGGYKTSTKFINTLVVPFEECTSHQPSSSIEYAGNVSITVIPRMRTAPLPTELSLVAFQSDICISFLMQNFLWRAYGDGWFEPAAKKQLDPLSSQAVRALSNIFFGMSHHQERSQLLACLQYGNVLGGLNGGLADPRRPGLENLLVPVLISLMYTVSWS